MLGDALSGLKSQLGYVEVANCCFCVLVLCGGNPETPNFDNSARRPFLWHSKGLDLERWSQVVAVTTGLFLFFPHLQKCTCHKVLGRQEVVYVRLLTGQSGTVNLKHFEKHVTYGVYHVSWSVVLRARALMILKFPQAKIFTKPGDNWMFLPVAYLAIYSFC